MCCSATACAAALCAVRLLICLQGFANHVQRSDVRCPACKIWLGHRQPSRTKQACTPHGLVLLIILHAQMLSACKFAILPCLESSMQPLQALTMAAPAAESSAGSLCWRTDMTHHQLTVQQHRGVIRSALPA